MFANAGGSGLRFRNHSFGTDEESLGKLILPSGLDLDKIDSVPSRECADEIRALILGVRGIIRGERL